MPALTQVLSDILVAERENQIFTHVYGYSLHAGLREKLAPIVLAPNSPVSWFQVKEARPYLKIENGELLVRYKKSAFWQNRLSSVLSTICLSITLALWIIIINYEPMTILQRVLVGSVSIALVVAALLAISWSAGFEAALKIERWLNRASESN